MASFKKSPTKQKNRFTSKTVLGSQNQISIELQQQHQQKSHSWIKTMASKWALELVKKESHTHCSELLANGNRLFATSPMSEQLLWKLYNCHCQWMSLDFRSSISSYIYLETFIRSFIASIISPYRAILKERWRREMEGGNLTDFCCKIPVVAIPSENFNHSSELKKSPTAH